MTKKTYTPSTIEDLGPIQDLTLGGVVSGNYDGLFFPTTDPNLAQRGFSGPNQPGVFPGPPK